jgi:uncharacterized RDD family membrane protein YckC
MSTFDSLDNESFSLGDEQEFRYASFQHRLASELLDFALALLTFWIGWAIWSLVVWNQGQTPAKKILKLRVYSIDTKKPATWGHMAVRQFLIIVALILTSGILDTLTFGILGSLGLVLWALLEVVWYFTKGQRTFRDHIVRTSVANEA